MNHLLALALCLAGFAALALAMQRQQHDLLGHALTRPAIQCLRGAGVGALVLALGSLVLWQGWGMGLVMFSGHTSLAAGGVFCMRVILARRRMARSKRGPSNAVPISS